MTTAGQPHQRHPPTHQRGHEADQVVVGRGKAAARVRAKERGGVHRLPRARLVPADKGKGGGLGLEASLNEERPRMREEATEGSRGRKGGAGEVYGTVGGAL